MESGSLCAREQTLKHPPPPTHPFTHTHTHIHIHKPNMTVVKQTPGSRVNVPQIFGNFQCNIAIINQLLSQMLGESL